MPDKDVATFIPVDARVQPVSCVSVGLLSVSMYIKKKKQKKKRGHQ